MANRYFESKVLTPTKRQVLLSGKIDLSAAAAVDANSIPHVSVAKSATGEYTLTLDDKYVELRSAQVSILTTEDVQARIKSHDVSSAKEVVLETATAGAPADVTAVAELHVTLILKDSSVGI